MILGGHERGNVITLHNLSEELMKEGIMTRIDTRDSNDLLNLGSLGQKSLEPHAIGDPKILDLTIYVDIESTQAWHDRLIQVIQNRPAISGTMNDT